MLPSRASLSLPRRVEAVRSSTPAAPPVVVKEGIMQIRVGVQAQPQHATYQQMRDAWRRVEESGADTLFNWDHFYPLSGDPDGLHYECWTLLAAMAEVT